MSQHRCGLYPDADGVSVIAEIGDGLEPCECPYVDIRFDGMVSVSGWQDTVELGRLSKKNMKQLAELLLEGAKRPRRPRRSKERDK